MSSPIPTSREMNFEGGSRSGGLGGFSQGEMSVKKGSCVNSSVTVCCFCKEKISRWVEGKKSPI